LPTLSLILLHPSSPHPPKRPFLTLVEESYVYDAS
jgi:hypothetical protein